MSKLSEALRAAAKKIEQNPKRYQWTDVQRCNCGFLVRVATKTTVVDLGKAIDQSDIGACWQGMVAQLNARSEALCPVSKKPLWLLVNELKEMGMQGKEFGELENLSNIDIRKRAGLSTDNENLGRNWDYDQWQSVVSYMRAWADMIDEKEKVQKLIKEVSAFSVNTLRPKTIKVKAGTVIKKKARGKNVATI